MRVVCLLIGLLFAGLIVSQTQKYHRVKIDISNNGILKLAQAGIAVDHGDFKKDVSFTSDLSDAEIKVVQKTGLSYEIVINDVSNFYAHQNDGLKNYNPKNEIMNAGSCNNCPQFITPQNFNLGSIAGFFTYQEMLDNLDSMAAKYPDLITVKQTIGSTLTFEGRELYYVKISDNPGTAEAEPQILYNSLHHAREVASLSQLIYYMWYLLENYSTNDEIKYLVDNLEMYFVPCVNPDGYIYNELTNPSGGGMWRKNRRDNGDGTFGVDLNRNYGFNWGYDDNGSSPDPVDDTYRGTAGFSEPETQLMRDFCNNHQFKLAVNNHTYSNLLIYPWGYIASFQTPDSATFQTFAKKMTRCSGFKYGTGDQTVGYLVNGDSDDWMYGEQISKPMILSMTPEAGSGSDGFWPATNRIIDICKTTMDQNLYAARLIGAYGEVASEEDYFVTSTSSYVHYDLTRYGLEPATLILYFTPISSNIQSGGLGLVNFGMNLFETRSDSVLLTLDPSIAQGDTVKYVLSASNGFYNVNDTIIRIYGQPVNAFYSDGNAITSFTSGGGTWGISTTQYVTATGSITDSPTGPYANNANKTVSTTSNIDLTNAVAANLSFYAKWDIEKGYDYVEILVSNDNGANYTQLCGRYTVEGTPDQNNGLPLYDGIQSDWVKESINLNDYLGQNIKLRFKLRADGFATGDGFYFDEMKVEKIINNIGLNELNNTGVIFQAQPNPASNLLTVKYLLKDESKQYKLVITDGLGRNVYSANLNNQLKEMEVNTSAFQSGVYFYQILADDIATPAKQLIIIQ